MPMLANIHETIQVMHIHTAHLLESFSGFARLVIDNRVEHACHFFVLFFHAQRKVEVFLAEEKAVRQQVGRIRGRMGTGGVAFRFFRNQASG